MKRLEPEWCQQALEDLRRLREKRETTFRIAALKLIFKET